jgi:hypothetical protein
MTPADLHTGSPSKTNWHEVLAVNSLTYIDAGSTTLTLGLHEYPDGATLGLTILSLLTEAESYITSSVLLLAISY